MPMFQQALCQTRKCGAGGGAGGRNRQSIAGWRQIAGKGLNFACRLPFFALRRPPVHATSAAD
jgi:hypothetical protein